MKVRQDFNVSISEIDYQDLWHRTKMGVAIVCNDYVFGERVIQEIFKVFDANPELERTITTVDRL